MRIERIGRTHESRVHELQTDIQSLRNELRSLKSASLTDSASKRKTFAGLTEENEKLNSELSQVSRAVQCTCSQFQTKFDLNPAAYFHDYVTILNCFQCIFEGKSIHLLPEHVLEIF